jgi:hypothetical protein
VGIDCRKFIVDDDGKLVRLRNSLFERLLRDPQHHTMPALAGQRARMAEILVQLAEHRPIRVVRRVYYVVIFDEAGRLDTTRFQQQQWALAESALDRLFTVPGEVGGVLDAASRFVAQGGQWRPSNDLAQRESPSRSDEALHHYPSWRRRSATAIPSRVPIA